MLKNTNKAAVVGWLLAALIAPIFIQILSEEMLRKTIPGWVLYTGCYLIFGSYAWSAYKKGRSAE